ncbi:hypothetical protein ACLESD_13115 [Pyxidicoccus sp. 3LFB2]
MQPHGALYPEPEPVQLRIPAWLEGTSAQGESKTGQGAQER